MRMPLIERPRPGEHRDVRRPGAAGVVGALACAALLFAALADCAKKQDDTAPSATPTATGYPAQGYPAQGYPAQGYPAQQPGAYAQPYPGQYPAPTASYGQYPAAPPPATAPVAPAPAPAPAPTAAPAASGQMAVPGPLAFQCQNDVPCGTHRCNTQYGKCAFPCQSAVDCISPAQCVAGLCIFSMTPPAAGH